MKTLSNNGQTRTLLLTLAIGGLMLAYGGAHAQGLTDALRLSGNEDPVGSRAAALNGALLGSIGGYDALQWNPAALAPNEFSEFGLHLSDLQHNSNATFLQNSLTSSDGSLYLSSIGTAFPMATSRGHLAFGISYDGIRDYTSTYSFKAVNPSSSFLNSRGFVSDPNFSPSTSGHFAYLDQYNLAWQLHLTYGVNDSGSATLTTPFKGGLEQSGTVTEEGGMHALRFGAGIDVAEKLSVGATVNLLFGSYTYRRVWNETDVNGLFSQNDTLPPLGFQSARIVDTRDQTQTGVSLKLGLLSYASDVVQFGATIETPSVFSVDDHFHRSGVSQFYRYSFTSTSDAEPDIVNTYDVVTPLKLAAGLTVNVVGIKLMASGTYADMSSIRFSNSPVDLSDLNDSARLNLRGVLSWTTGAEYIIAPLGLSLRASFGIQPSPYKAAQSSFDKKTFGFGAGILLSKSVLLEASYRRTTYSTDHLLYNDRSAPDPITGVLQSLSATIPSDQIDRDQIDLGISFRF